jgi:hypothetical protein
MLPSEFGFNNFLNIPWWVKFHLVESGLYVGLAWSVVYVFYFGYRLLGALKELLPSGNPSD